MSEKTEEPTIFMDNNSPGIASEGSSEHHKVEGEIRV